MKCFVQTRFIYIIRVMFSAIYLKSYFPKVWKVEYIILANNNYGGKGGHCSNANFLSFLSSNIPSGPSYGVYISQLIRYARCCSHYDDFRYRHKCLVDRLLSQGYKALRLEKSFKKFYGRYQDLIEKYRRSVNAMVSDSFPGQFLFNM